MRPLPPSDGRPRNARDHAESYTPGRRRRTLHGRAVCGGRFQRHVATVRPIPLGEVAVLLLVVRRVRAADGHHRERATDLGGVKLVALALACALGLVLVRVCTPGECTTGLALRTPCAVPYSAIGVPTTIGELEVRA